MCKCDERIIALTKITDEALQCLEQLSKDYKPFLKGERFITDAELSKRLQISRRTLQDWRSDGKLSYILLGGKIIYKESDIEKLLNDNYCKSFN